MKIRLTPAQAEAVALRAEACDVLAAALDGRMLEVSAEVDQALVDASNAEDEWGTYWKRRREPELARAANRASSVLANVFLAMGKAMRAAQVDGGASR